MKTIISNEITVYEPTQELLSFCKTQLILTNPLYEQLMRLGKEDQIRRRHVPKDMALYSKGFGYVTIPFGCLNAIWKYIKNYPFETRFNDNGTVMPRSLVISKPLYDYQQDAADAMLKNRGGVLIGGCGSGKTNIMVSIVYTLGKRALWLTHTSDLLRQSVNRFKELYPSLDIGTITDGEVNIGRDVTVATVQTLAKIDPEVYKNTFDVVIVDEVHHCASSPTLMKQFGTVINRIAARYKFGATASEKRNDTLTKSIYAYIGANPKGELLPTYKISRDDANTLTAKHVRFNLDTKMYQVDALGQFHYPFLNTDGTFNYANLIEFLSTDKQRNLKICDNIEKYKDRKQLVLCARIKHCELIYNELIYRGIKAVLLVGKVTDKKRKQILNREIEYSVLISTCALCKEGIDLPELSVLHLATPISNKSDTVQSVGRIERVCPNKPEPICFDYVDNNPYCISRFNKRAGWIKNRK